ncbi:MAG TPA: hypothetical protein VF337_09550 [Candidatus Limnocylindrales bacterium]
MEFVVRSPLSAAECTDRLSQGFEGPIPKLGAKVTDWNVYGTVKSNHVEATIAGLKVAPDGKKRRSLRPVLTADLNLEKGETVVRGRIESRYGGGQANGRNKMLGPVIVLGVSTWATLDLPTRWPILVCALAYLAVFAYGWLADRRLTPWRLEGELELLAWLEMRIDGTRD